MALTPPTDTDLLKQARDRYKLADEADSDQSKREADDLRFYAGDQWPADIINQRQGQQGANGLPPVPARPTLVINKLREPVRQILNQERQSDVGIQLIPADDFGDLGIIPDDTETELREGLTRRIQRESDAQDARRWAFARAVQAGRGYYRVMTRYLPGPTWDQEVYIDRIYNQAGVLLDPTHTKPDGSDADYGFIGTWVPWERFAKEYPKAVGDKGRLVDNPFADADETDFIRMAEAYPEWYREEREAKAVRVVEYWYTERTSKDYALLADGQVVEADAVPEGVEVVDTRTVVEKSIEFCKIGGGVLILEQTTWPGRYLPIIKVTGEELQPYDGTRREEGVVRPARDAQQGENYMISKFVETVGLTPIAPMVVDPEAMDGYEAFYSVLNTRALPYVPARTYDDQGRQLAQPHRPATDPNILPMAQGISLFDQFIKSTTAVPDPTLGNVDPSLKSGRAIREVVANAALSTSNFMDNLTHSMRYEGMVINDLLYPIYGKRPGRLVRILTGEGEPEMRQVGEQEPQAMPQPPGLLARMRGMLGGGQPPQANSQQQRAAQVGKLTEDANFNVIVKVTKSSESRREQFVRMFSEILGADPNQMMVAGDLFYKNMDIPDAAQLAKRQRVMLAPPIQQYLDQQESGQEPIPPQAQAQMAQMQQQLQHAEAAMQELAQQAEGKQMEAQTKLQMEQLKQDAENQRAQMEAQVKVALQQMSDATQIRLAEIKAGVTGHTLLHEADAMGRQQNHEAALEMASQDHEREMAQMGMAHADAQQDAEQAHQYAMQPQEPTEAGEGDAD